MPNANNAVESAGQAGSSSDDITIDPFTAGVEGQSDGTGTGAQNGNGGEETANLTPDEKKELDNLRTAYGDQGRELGDYRKFFEQTAPLLEKLDAQPELIQAILEGKVDSSLAKAALEGKVPAEATLQVQQAHQEVKTEAGKGYEKLTPAEVEARIVDKLQGVLKTEVQKVESNLKGSIEAIESQREFDAVIREFVAEHPDFAEHANEVWAWFEEHPDQYDISVAYDAVTGKKLRASSKKQGEDAAAEEAKNIALNVGVGGSQSSGIIRDDKLVDQLIAGPRTPGGMF